MTGRERWLAVLNGEKPDRIPMDYWATGEASQKLCEHMGCDLETALARLHVDHPASVGGRYVGPPPPEGQDIWGLERRQVSYGSGVYSEVVGDPPLARFGSVEEIEAGYRWPSPDDWDYSHLPAAVQALRDRPVRGGGSEPFLLYKLLRGEAQAFVDLIENPEIVHYCLGRLFDLAYQETLRVFESIPGVVMITYVAEDVGFAGPRGDITVTECQMVNHCKGSATEAPRFTRGYGLAFGHCERKTMGMALVDRALRAGELGEEVKAPAQDEEFVLMHSDNVQATGFVEHLKLPHYVDFQSELGLLRKLRKEFSEAAEASLTGDTDRASAEVMAGGPQSDAERLLD